MAATVRSSDGASTFAYHAFISYSHAADGKLAPALQSALHRLGKPWFRLRSMRVFRDKTSLAMSAELWPSIEAALQQAKYFVLMASPEAAASAWVQKEVDWWIGHRGPDSLFLVLTDGDLVWDSTAGDFNVARSTAVPASLHGRFAGEPLYVDLRWAKSASALSLRHSRFRAAVLDVAAALLDRPKDELDGEDIRQHRRTTAVASAAALLIAAAALVATWQAYLASQRYQIALSRQLAAEALNHLDSQPDLGLLLAVAATEVRDTVEARSSLLHALESSPWLDRILARPTQAQGVAFGPDGTVVAGYANGETLRWDLRDAAQPVARLGAGPAPIRAVAVSPDGRSVAASDRDGEVTLWTAGAGPTVYTDHDAAVDAVDFSGDGRWLAAAGEDSLLVVRDLGSDREPSRIRLGGTLMALDIDRTGSLVAVGSASDWGEDGTITLWTRASGDTTSFSAGPGESVRSVAFDPAGRRLAAAGTLGTIVVWDLGSLPPRRMVSSPPSLGPLWSVAFSPDGRTLAAAGESHEVTLWDAATMRQVGQPLRAHAETIYSVSFDSGGQRLASADRSGRVLVWDLSARQPAYTQGDEVWTLALSRDGRTLASGSKDGTIALFDIDASRSMSLTGRHASGVSSVAFVGDDARRLVSAGHDFAVVEWDLGPSPTSRVLTRDGTSIRVMAVPGTDALVAGGTDGRIWRWETPTASPSPFGRVHQSEVIGLAITPDGRLLASVDASGRLYLWNAATGEWLRELPGPARAWSLAFAPRGKILAVGYGDGRIALWNVEDGQEGERPLGSHRAGVKSLAFSHDGALIASGDEQGSIVLWDVGTGQRIGPELAGHHGAIVTGMAFEPGNPPAWLASSGDDAAVMLWDLSLTSWRRLACHRANRDLSLVERSHYLEHESGLVVCPAPQGGPS
ncbi:MAG: TIR domain-containing protein [Vicinamibacterales bacterium]